MLREYLGDAVYAEFDGFNIVLTTSDGLQITNEIVLEPEIVARFIGFKVRVDAFVREKLAEMREAKEKV